MQAEESLDNDPQCKVWHEVEGNHHDLVVGEKTEVKACKLFFLDAEHLALHRHDPAATRHQHHGRKDQHPKVDHRAPAEECEKRIGCPTSFYRNSPRP